MQMVKLDNIPVISDYLPVCQPSLITFKCDVAASIYLTTAKRKLFVFIYSLHFPQKVHT